MSMKLGALWQASAGTDHWKSSGIKVEIIVRLHFERTFVQLFTKSLKDIYMNVTGHLVPARHTPSHEKEVRIPSS